MKSMKVFLTLLIALFAFVIYGCNKDAPNDSFEREQNQGQTRLIKNFNHDWQFVRVNDKPKPIDEKFLVPRDNWEIISVSSEETQAEQNSADNAFDGNPNSFWHTKWQGTADKYPHELVIDLGDEYNLQGLTYLPRQQGDNGMISHFELYASNNKNDWSSALTQGKFANEKRLQIVTLAKPVKARYVKFVALDAINGADFASVAELGFLKIDDREKASDWQAQFSVLHVDDISESEDSEKVKTLQEELAVLKDKPWENVILPHTAYIEPLVVNNQWQGICFYKKTFDVTDEMKGKKLFIKFEGAMELADVWINGKHLIQHAGGYLPFMIDITDVVNYGSKNSITVKLDNYDHPEIPPGKPLAGVDFSYYHGIYRDVNFIVSDKLHITDPVAANLEASGGVFVTYSDVSTKQATVNIKTHVQNCDSAAANTIIQQKLIDRDGKEILNAKSDIVNVAANNDNQFSQSLTVTNPNLWSPDNPYLYTLVTTVLKDDKAVDEIQTRIGIRWFEFTRNAGFKVNGKPVYLLGTNRHQEHPYIGNALSKNAQYRDILRIRNAGFNFLRLGHYPQDPSVLNACDELGMIVVEPIPGWQFFNKSDVFIQRVYQNVRDMIRRDRNHASIALWEVVLNESWAPQELETTAYEITHKEFPGAQCFACGDPYGAKCWDVSYNQWKEDITRPQDAQPDKAGIIREYGDFEFGGHYSTSRQYRRDGEKGLLQSAWNFQWSLNRYKGQYPWTAGCATWLMFDHNRGGSENIEASGASDIFRIPKFTYYFYQSQRDPKVQLPKIENGPMVYIANYWNQRQSPTKVIAYSNCDEVELFLNGKSLGKQKPDNGPSTEYGPRYTGGNPFDRGNSENLDHGPFTFIDILWAKGTLKAVGYIDGKAVTENSVITAGEPVAMKINFDTFGIDLTADGSDVIFVHATLVDKDGNPNYLAANEITFEVEGPANIIGPATINAEAGIATILLQATTQPGKITIKTSSSNIENAIAVTESKITIN
ncbi:MAG: discoidin domain-containing protein [Phycisphaerae bacterium]|nr:discoidin domain-containing protein [Phycisphaerae bacterium]